MHKNDREKCPICFKTFRNIMGLKSHHLDAHEEKTRICGIDGCGFKYSNPNKYSLHKYKAHSTVKKFTCKICGEQYKYR